MAAICGTWAPLRGYEAFWRPLFVYMTRRAMAIDVNVTNATISVDDTGEGTPVLLLHGFPATRSLWSRVAPLLRNAGFRVVVPDLVGYGNSEAPTDVRVDMASQARWMLELCDVLAISRPVVVAHDVGSAAAQLMVVDAPHRVRGLAVLDGVFAGEWAMQAIASIRAWDPSKADRILPIVARRLAKTTAMQEMLAAYEGQEGGQRLIRAARDLDPGQTEHIGEALSASEVPAVVLWGDQDEFLPVDSVARPLAHLLRAALVLLPGGHFTPLDCPAEVANSLVHFFARLPP
jgi:2-hydroxymuconate-semialdehyde hydrolase